MPTADTEVRHDAPQAHVVEVSRASKADDGSLLHSLLGTLLAAVVAALALWPHVRTLIE